VSTETKPKPLTVRELQSILAECDPEATVNLYIPGFIDASDKQVIEDPDLAGDGYSYVPQIEVCYATSAETPYEHFFNEDGSVRPGLKPNTVGIVLAQEIADDLFKSRKRAIEADDEDAGMEPEPVVSDAETVVVDVRIRRDVHTSIRTLLRSVNASRQVKVEQACTHGLLTVAGALEMLAEDLGMVETRPGSWEGSNMASVLSSHGYNA